MSPDELAEARYDVDEDAIREQQACSDEALDGELRRHAQGRTGWAS